MSASYPSAAKSFTPVANGNTVAASFWNDGYDEITALEQALLSGGLAHNLFPDSLANARTLGTASKPWGLSFLKALTLTDATELTVATGAIDATQGYHTVDTESDAASDDLDTITATGLTAGFILVLRAENVARVVTLKDGTGNLLLNGDYALSATDRTITLLFDGTNWREIARSVQTASAAFFAPFGGQLTAGTTGYMGQNAFNTTESTAYGSVPVACTISQLYVRGDGAPGSGQTFVFTVRKNGVDTTLTATMSDAATTASDTTHSVSFAAGDYITIKVVASGGASTRVLSAAVRVS